jgi:stage II sporulation protein R
MKKFFICFLLFLGLVFAAYSVGAWQNNSQSSAISANANADYLRIHVRANSNSAQDQSVKYQVKDEVVKFITPYVAECYTKDKAVACMQNLLPQIKEVCDGKLSSLGYAYTSTAKICSEQFPTRVYGELTLEEGMYDALIIELGSGTGDNWWCVIYPPLCFTSSTTSVTYRSAIYDIINKFINK